jgi:ribosomal-protein-alanine N-acetyltransferase
MDEYYKIPGSRVKIIPAAWRDLRDLQQLEKLCFQLDAWPLLDLIGLLSLPQIIRLKAVADHIMIGFIGVDLRRAQRTAWIATLAVHPEYRRIGIGSKLLEVCEDKVRGTLPRIRLCVRQSNLAAIELYKKFGYLQVDIWKSYYRGGDNALVFEKKLVHHSSP